MSRDLTPPSPPRVMNSLKVAGVCPACCGPTLFLGDGGHITCSNLRCTSPTAAGELLGPHAFDQRHAEATTLEEEREVIGSQLEKSLKQSQALEDQVRILLPQLAGAWWLQAADAYRRLSELVSERSHES